MESKSTLIENAVVIKAPLPAEKIYELNQYMRVNGIEPILHVPNGGDYFTGVFYSKGGKAVFRWIEENTSLQEEVVEADVST